MSKAQTKKSICASDPYEHIARAQINFAGTHKFAFAPVRSAQPWSRSQTIHFEGGCSTSEENRRSTLKEHVWVQMGGRRYSSLIARGFEGSRRECEENARRTGVD